MFDSSCVSFVAPDCVVTKYSNGHSQLQTLFMSRVLSSRRPHATAGFFASSRVVSLLLEAPTQRIQTLLLSFHLPQIFSKNMRPQVESHNLSGVRRSVCFDKVTQVFQPCASFDSEVLGYAYGATSGLSL